MHASTICMSGPVISTMPNVAACHSSTPMANTNFNIDPHSGFCTATGIYHTLRDPVPLPPSTHNLDITTFVFSHHHTTDIALIDAPTGCSLSYAALRRNVKSLSTGLHCLGIGKGDVVLVLSPNSIHIPCIYMAIFSLGAILTTSNPLNTQSEIQTQVRDSNPAAVFTVPHLIKKLGPIRARVILIEGTQNLIEKTQDLTLSHLLTQGGRIPFEGAIIRQEDPASLLYSSGTTGKPKGVVATHRNHIAVVAANRARYPQQPESSPMVWLCSSPMFHIYGVRLVVSSLAAGATIAVMPKYDMGEMLHYIEKYRVTLLPTVPYVLGALAKSRDVYRYELSSLQQIGLGGAPLGKDVIREFSAKFPGIQIRQGYGMTETTGAVVYTNSDEENRRSGTVGLLSAVVEAKVVDPDSAKPLSPNHKGELWLRGPTIMKGYYNNEEATKATLDSEGWLRTGDLCYIDEGGFVYLVDRLKDLIKYKAFQVAPAELEDLLLSHPEIIEAVVIPYPDEGSGQIPMAYIVKNSDTKLDEKDVLNFVAKQVAPYKKIRRVAFLDSIPKNSSGKILRKDLIKMSMSASRL